MSIRVRLALFFTLLTGATLALISITTYQLMRQGFLAEIERDLPRRAQAFAASHATPYYLDLFAAPDVLLQMVEGTGTPVAGSGNVGGRVLPLSTEMREGRVVEARAAGGPLFLTAAPLGDGRFIIVARSPITIYETLRRFRGLLSAVVVGALVATGGLGWLVLDRSHRRMRELLTESVHELRAPLTLILGNLDLLSRSGAGDPAFSSRAIADIRSEAHRMTRMVTQLLILGRADAGAQMTLEPVALADAVADVCRQGHGMAEDVRFTTALDVRLEEVVIRGNADSLRQLILILVDNALKHTPAGGEVRVETSIESGRARITVSDTGAGIDPDDLPRIFDRFYRGRNARGTAGTGLGLTIARWVAEQHGGEIAVESTPGRGSRFSVMLPLADRSSLPDS